MRFIRATEKAKTKGDRHGAASRRIDPLAPDVGRLVHRNGVAGPDHRGAGAGAAAGRAGDLRGRAQTWGGPVRKIHAGDVVWFPPGEKHWHGAAPSTAMVHVAMQEALDGKHVEWMEQVTQEQYTAEVAR